MFFFSQDFVGLIISILLLGDFSLTLLTLLQFYSISILAFLTVLLILPLASLIPFFTGIFALFSHGPQRSADHARIYALWNATSLINTVSLQSFFLLSVSWTYMTVWNTYNGKYFSIDQIVYLFYQALNKHELFLFLSFFLSKNTCIHGREFNVRCTHVSFARALNVVLV